jgi:hypothetical protein
MGKRIISIMFICLLFSCNEKKELAVSDIQNVLHEYMINADVELKKFNENDIIFISLKEKYKLVKNDEREQFLRFLTFLLKDKISESITYHIYIDKDKGKDNFKLSLKKKEINEFDFNEKHIKMLVYCFKNFKINSVYDANNVLSLLKEEQYEVFSTSFYDLLRKFSNEKENSNSKFESTKTILYLYDFLMRFYEDDEVKNYNDLKIEYKELANHLSNLWSIQRADFIDEKRKEAFGVAR